MKYLITGGSGQLGYDVAKELNSRGEHAVWMPSREFFDLTDKESIEYNFRVIEPDIIIHCAAYTNVDGAEDDYENAYKVNVEGTRYVAEMCNKYNVKLVYVSTDYVYDGTKRKPYVEIDSTNPLNNYGKTKLLGEKEAKKANRHFIVRTSWVFGINGKNFVKTMLNLAKTKDELNVVSDQFGTPTYTKDLAKAIVSLSQTDLYGIYHITNEGFTNWYYFAKRIFETNNIDIQVNPVTSKEYPQKAHRPAYSVLSKEKLYSVGIDRMPDWKDALDRYNEELGQQKEK